MSLIEAMACGVPIVAPRRGTYTELLTRTGGGLRGAPENATALEDILLRVDSDRAT